MIKAGARCALGASLLLASAPAVAAGVSLAADGATRHAGSIAETDRVLLRVTTLPGARMFLRARADSADLIFEDGSADRAWRSNSPASDVGTEYLVLPPRAQRHEHLVVLAVDPHTGGRGRYEIELGDAGDPDFALAELLAAASWNYLHADGGSDTLRRVAQIEQAREQCEASRDRRCEAESRLALGVLYRGAADFARAERELERADAGFASLGLTSGRIATAIGHWSLMMQQGRTGEARAALVQAARLAEDFGQPVRRASIENNFGLMHHYAGELDRALLYYDRARTLLGELPLQLAVTLRNNIGGIHYLRGDPLLAEQNFRSAIALAGDDPRLANDRAHALGNLGNLQSDLGLFETALDAHREALSIYRITADQEGEARSLNRMGLQLEKLRRLDAAQALFSQARNLCRVRNDVGCESVAQRGLGRVALARGDMAMAETGFRQAIELASKAGNVESAAHAVRGLTELLLAQDRPAESLALLDDTAHTPGVATLRWHAGWAGLQRARALIALQRNDEADTELRQAESLLSGFGQLPTLASVRLEQARLAKTQADIGRAVERYRRALDNIESLRADFVSDELQAEFAATQAAAYRELAALKLDNYARTRDRAWMTGAFATIERGRARALLDAVTAPDGLSANDETLRHWQSLRAKSLTLQRLQTGAGEPDPEGITRLESEIAALRATLELAQGRDSAQARAKVLGAPRSLAQVQAGLPAATVLLLYQLHDERGWLWRIDAAGADVIALADAHAIGPRVTRLLESIRDRDRDFSADARALHAQLIAPATLAPQSRLVIVPDRELLLLPFATLIDAEGRYLIERHALSTLPSASLGIALRERAPPPGPSGDAEFVIFSDPVFSVSDARAQNVSAAAIAAVGMAEQQRGPDTLEHLARLPGTAAEAAAIVRALGADRVRVYAGFDATLGAARGEPARRARILHFATHGLVDADAPESTGLALSRLAPDRTLFEDDGFFSLPMIHRTRYAAELVVLSACDTALGRRLDGEGLMGIARAFFTAGAGSVLATHWAVPDRAMESIMADFYLALERDALAPPEALQSAVRIALTRPRLRHPRNWAALSLFGLHWETSRTRDTLMSTPRSAASETRGDSDEIDRVDRSSRDGSGIDADRVRGDVREE